MQSIDDYEAAIANNLRDFALSWIHGLTGLLQQSNATAPPMPSSSRARHPSRRAPSTVQQTQQPPPASVLPPNFPFGNFDLRTQFEWIHEYDFGTIWGVPRRESIQHRSIVNLVFQGRAGGVGSSIAWEVRTTVTEGQSTIHIPFPLAVFEIDGNVWEECTTTSLPLAIDSALVLEAISHSLSARRPVRLTSRTELVPVDPSRPYIRATAGALWYPDPNTATLQREYGGGAVETVLRMLCVYELRLQLAVGDAQGAGLIREIGRRWRDDA
ncbi:hypothetical protein HMN09_00821200 [Mycena chlorophos]|uniref:Uncharacterized protein n=1 Tax=Mycena chlorophos TaxID=658473 RepID=A0A8H6ST74_MYCCL|nr:hypothetical protein HMN09_00821200 [Mycena chlorophos]